MEMRGVSDCTSTCIGSSIGFLGTFAFSRVPRNNACRLWFGRFGSSAAVATLVSVVAATFGRFTSLRAVVGRHVATYYSICIVVSRGM